MIGIDNISKAAKAMGQGGSIMYEVWKDGKLSIRDASELKEIFQLVKGLAGIDFKALKPELDDADELEKDALANTFAEYLKVGGGTTEQTIEMGFTLLINAIDMLQTFLKWGEK